MRGESFGHLVSTSVDKGQNLEHFFDNIYKQAYSSLYCNKIIPDEFEDRMKKCRDIVTDEGSSFHKEMNMMIKKFMVENMLATEERKDFDDDGNGRVSAEVSFPKEDSFQKMFAEEEKQQTDLLPKKSSRSAKAKSERGPSSTSSI